MLMWLFLVHLLKGDENQNPDKPREGGLRVVRVGQQQKIHPDILPISLDELAKKNLAKGVFNHFCLISRPAW